MGLLTRYFWRFGARCLSAILVSPEIAAESERQLQLSSGNLALSEAEERKQRNLIKGIYFTSFAADFTDYLNTILDLIFASFLFQLSDSTVYAVVLLIGIVLGRIIVVRGTYLLTRNGISWTPFRMAGNGHENRAMRLLHTLFFTETAVFMFEDYPCLVIYGHWSTINFPPVPLRTIDDVNVAFTVVSLMILTSAMVASIVWSWAHLNPSKWSGWVKVRNYCKVVLSLVLCVLLLRFAILALKEAFSFTILNDKQLPSNVMLGIPICDEETHETRADYCDEKSFLIHVLCAWLAAAYLCFFLFFRAAPQEENTLLGLTSTTKLGALAVSACGKDSNQTNDPDASSTHLDTSANKGSVHDSDGIMSGDGESQVDVKSVTSEIGTDDEGAFDC